MKSKVQKIDTKKANSTAMLGSSTSKRKGWSKAFKAMAAHGDDKLLIPDCFIDEVKADWKW